MKHYIGTKLIQAEPMSLEEAQKVLGREIKPATDETDGYLVEYDNGYKSWSPKTVFEKAYKLAETFLDRMKVEHSDLFDKLDKARKFMHSESYKALPELTQTLLNVQFKTQAVYCRLLGNRIDLAGGYAPGLAGFDFGTAIKFLNEGYCIRRKGWHGKGMFVCKLQPFEDKMVKYIIGLSESAKKNILQHKDPSVRYKSILLIVLPDNTVNSWTASSEDIFAHDWEVVLDEEVEEPKGDMGEE